MAKDIKLNLKPGRYFAGVDIPFIVPDSSIVDGVEELGGRGVTITKRAKAQLTFDPRKDPKYSDDWEEVVIADYPGPAKSIETPRRWKWLMVIKDPAPSSSTPGTTSNTPGVVDIVTSASTPEPVERKSGAGGAMVVLGVAAAAGVGVLLWKRRRRR